MTKKYRLLKDLPNVKAGAIVEWNSTETWVGGPYEGGRYGIFDMPNDKSQTVTWSPYDVENNPEWFEEITEPERITVKLERQQHCDPRIKPLELIVIPSVGIAEWQMPLIKQAIEAILNDDAKSYWETLDRFAAPVPVDTVVKDTGLVQDLGLKFDLSAYDKFQPKYNQIELDKAIEDVFNAARERLESQRFQPFKFATFSDYLNHIKQ